MSKELSTFVYDALRAGKSRSDIAEVLIASGWAKSEVTHALGEWAEVDFSPPVTRPHATASARDFFVYALTFGVLIFGAINLVILGFHIIDFLFEDSARGYRSSGMRWAIAALIVAAPLYFWLAVRDRRAVDRDAGQRRSLMRRWLTYVTLLIAAVAFLGDAIAVIYALLQGDLTGQFLLKAAVVAAVAGGVFAYYLSDIRKDEDA
ncbi:DUF5671 domain-containing protein [uncultured Tateyamaria sp.]|uniref:DUF5671 domain-containing protein n=1 Tax=uncultured Tateyamaria sp. TaxID=455651 RepID=UPI0026358741|nr:DUF5671 domain-containing protein [uncultured Tateyamaria sp.]